MKNAALGILLFTVASRLVRVAGRWDEWALHYATYNEATRDALLSGNIVEALTSWVGLHPPGYPLLHSVVSLVWPAPIVWLLISAGASVVTVWAMLRSHPQTVIPALVVATDPVQLHYAAEVNNYPLATMLLALAWMAHRRDHPVLLGVVAFLACWVHLICAVGVGLIAATSRYRYSLYAVMTGAGLLLAPEAIGIVMDEGSRKQPPLDLVLSLRDALDRFGPSWVVLLPLLVGSLHRSKQAGILWVGLVTVWVSTVWAGFAAPHQFPYACFLGIPAAALIGASTVSRHRLAVGVSGVLIIRGLFAGLSDGMAVSQVAQDQSRSRAIDVVLERAVKGDAIILVRGPGPPDDDKRHTSSVLWRFSPFTEARPIRTDGRSTIEGHPFLIDGVRVYTFAHPRAAIGAIEGPRVFTILYDGAEQNPNLIPAHPSQGDWQPVGPDLWRATIGS